MVVTVEARQGKEIPPLHREDVAVHQGRNRLRVTEWLPLQGQNAGVEMFVLLDDASAFTLGNHLEELRHFINEQPPTTAIAVGYMRNGSYVEAAKFTADHAAAAQAIRLPMGITGINSSPYLSLSTLARRWPGAGALRREVLMVTDGVDRIGGTGPLNPYVDSAIDDIQRAGIVVYCIYSTGSGHFGHSGWRTMWGQNYLGKIADESGGESYYIGSGDPVTFAPYLSDLTARLAHQHLLTFLARPQKKADFQSVKLATEIPNAELVSADRVWVPAGR